MKIIFSLFIILNGFGSKSQGHIGQTEQDIITAYKDNPNMEIKIDYIKGKRTIIAQDYDAIMAFSIDAISKLCTMSIMYIKNENLLKKLIPFFDTHYTIIIKGQKWDTYLNNHEIRIDLRYSSKMQESTIIWYTPH